MPEREVKLSQRVKDALDETRMLVLGVQVLLGFCFRAFFEPRFDTLSPLVRASKLGSLALLVIVLGLLLVPVAWHRIVSEGEDTPELEVVTRNAATGALLPFAVALGAELAVAGAETCGNWVGALLGVAMCAFAIAAWYGLPRAQRRPRASEDEEMEPTKLSKKIDHALIECRVVLPGSQALLGFQLITILMDSFTRLPLSSKLVHLASLTCVAISVVLLMFPAAYHRIAENGEFSERLLVKSGRAIIAALAFLALGTAGDFFVVVRKLTESFALSALLGVAMLVLFYSAWFVAPLVARAGAHGGRVLAARR